VVELKNPDIRSAAVDTWMCEQILDQPGSVLSDNPAPPLARLVEVVLLVRRVVPLDAGSPTVHATPATGRKLGWGSFGLAFRADRSQLHGISHLSGLTEV